MSASKKITELPELTTAENNDTVVIVDASEPDTSKKTKRISKENLIKEIKAEVDQAVEDAGDAVAGLETHIADHSNPHEVTKAQVGLGNADNTSDANKPISNATATALANKSDVGHTHTASNITDFDDAVESNPNVTANTLARHTRNADSKLDEGGASEVSAFEIKSHLGATNNPHAVTKGQVGLGNVTNDAQVKRSEMGQANGVSTLGSDGKIPTSQLPALAITNTFVVLSQAEQLALSAQEGDVAVRVDLQKSFIKNSGTAGTMADWQELLTPTDAVQSVNGKTGSITLTTSDISEGTNLYYTTGRANADFDTRLATKSTTNLSEGTNLYFTNARAVSALTGENVSIFSNDAGYLVASSLSPYWKNDGSSLATADWDLGDHKIASSEFDANGGLITAPNAPSSFNTSIIYTPTYYNPGDPIYANSAQTFRFRVYSYKKVGGSKILSASYLDSGDIQTDSGYDGSIVSISGGWDTNNTDADGYLVFIYDDVRGYNFDTYFDFGTPTFNGSNWFFYRGFYNNLNYGSEGDFQKGGTMLTDGFSANNIGSAFLASQLIKFTTGGGFTTGATGEYLSTTFGMPIVMATPNKQDHPNYGVFRNVAFIGNDDGYGALGMVVNTRDDFGTVNLVGTKIGSSGNAIILQPGGGYPSVGVSIEDDPAVYGLIQNYGPLTPILRTYAQNPNDPGAEWDILEVGRVYQPYGGDASQVGFSVRDYNSNQYRVSFDYRKSTGRALFYNYGNSAMFAVGDDGGVYLSGGDGKSNDITTTKFQVNGAWSGSVDGNVTVYGADFQVVDSNSIAIKAQIRASDGRTILGTVSDIDSSLLQIGGSISINTSSSYDCSQSGGAMPYGRAVIGNTSGPQWVGNGFAFSNTTVGSQIHGLIVNGDAFFFGSPSDTTPPTDSTSPSSLVAYIVASNARTYQQYANGEVGVGRLSANMGLKVGLVVGSGTTYKMEIDIDGGVKLADYTGINTPQEGMIAWDFTAHTMVKYNGSAWV